MYRLFYMLGRAHRLHFGDAFDPTIRSGTGNVVIGDDRVQFAWSRARKPSPTWIDDLAANLDELVRLTREAHAEPVLLTYASEDHTYRIINRELRASAARTGARLIDVAAVFQARCPNSDCADLFFPDRHPTPAGHRLYAETLMADWSGWSGDTGASDVRAAKP